MLNENMQYIRMLKGFKDSRLSIDYYTRDLFHDIPEQNFELVVFNPPYLPQDEEIEHSQLIDQAIYGGPEGISTIREFFSQVGDYIDSNSRIYFILSSLGSLHNLIPFLESNFHIELIQNIHMFFEDFGLFYAKKKSKITNNL